MFDFKAANMSQGNGDGDQIYAALTRGPSSFWTYSSTVHGRDLSFLASHAHGIPAPPKTSRHSSHTLHDATVIEKASAGTLKSVKYRDLSKLCLRGNNNFNLDWARGILSSTGPSIDTTHKFHEVNPKPLRTGLITCEGDVGIYTDYYVWERLKFTGELLYLAAHYNDKAIPAGPCNMFIHTPTTGPSGRADRVFEYPAVDPSEASNGLRGVLLVELKPSYTCTSKSSDMKRNVVLLDELDSYLKQHLEFVLIRDVDRAQGDWKKKASSMFYQTWHQSLHFAVTHQIFSNEEQFIMTLREENTVWVSEPLQWHYEGDPEETKLAFAKASLFLAHALDTHLPSLSGPFKPQAAPPAIDAKVKVNAPGSNKGSPEPSALPSSHPMTLRSVTKKMLEKALPSVPGEIVFGAKGIHTLTLKLTAMSPHRYPCRQKPLYALALFSEKLGLSALYKGQFEGENVFIKMVVDDENSEQSLIREFYLYSVLSSLQGVLIPKCIGLFRVDKSTQILVTSDCGVRLKSFKQLDDIQSQALLKSVRQIHALRVCHNDLAPRNVVQDDKGKLTIVDFGLGENSHRCDGDCLEILDLETQLGEHLL